MDRFENIIRDNNTREKPIQNDYIQDIMNKLFNIQLTKQTIDFSRPGTAGDYIRKSLAYHKMTG